MASGDSTHERPEQESAPVKERMTTLRWVALFLLAALFVSDHAEFGFQVWRKPVPDYAYWVLGAISVGIEIPAMRDFAKDLIRKMVGGKDDN